VVVADVARGDAKGWRPNGAGRSPRQAERRGLVPGAVVCTVAASVVHTVATFFLRNWFGAYGHAYGGFGVSLALAAFVGIIASLVLKTAGQAQGFLDSFSSCFDRGGLGELAHQRAQPGADRQPEDQDETLDS